MALIAQSIAVIEVSKCCGLSEDYDSSLDTCVPKKPDHDYFFMKQPVLINLGAEATLQTNPVNDSLRIKFENCDGNLTGYDYEVNEKGQLFTYSNEPDELSEPHFYNDFCLDFDSFSMKKIYKVCNNYMEIHKCCKTSQELTNLTEKNYTCVDRNKSIPLIDIGDFFKFVARKSNPKFVINNLVQEKPGIILDINDIQDLFEIEEINGTKVLRKIQKFEYCFDKLNGSWTAYLNIDIPVSPPAQAQVSFAIFPVVLSILCLVITFVIFCKMDFMKHPYMIIFQFLVICTTMEMICILIEQFYTSEYFVTFIQDCFLVLSCCSLTLIWLVISTKHKGFSGSDIVITSLIIVYYITFLILRYNSYVIQEAKENPDFYPRTLVFIFVLFAYIAIANFHKWLTANLDNKLMKMDEVKKYFYGW